MEVILLSKVNKLGDSGVVVNVKSGYARNFLIPTGKAILANKTNIQSFEAQRVALEKENVNKLLVAQSRAKKIKEIKSINIKSKSGKGGKIFGSVGVRDIVKAMMNIGIKINKKEIRLINGLLRHIGEHKILFQFHNEVKVEFIINIISK